MAGGIARGDVRLYRLGRIALLPRLRSTTNMESPALLSLTCSGGLLIAVHSGLRPQFSTKVMMLVQ
jgi:hypothetical protein